MNKICTRCGKMIPGEPYDEAGVSLCWNCYCRAQQDKQIHEPSFQPDSTAYGFGNRYFTVTVQFSGNLDGEKACQIMRHMNRGRELIICRHSSSSDGFELVSYPMTLEFYRKFLNWMAVLQEAHSLGHRVRRFWVRSGKLRVLSKKSKKD